VPEDNVNNMPSHEPAQDVPPQAATPSGNTAQPVNNGSHAPSSADTTFFTALTDMLNAFPPGTFPLPGVQAASGTPVTLPEDTLPGTPQDTPNATTALWTSIDQGQNLSPLSINAILSAINHDESEVPPQPTVAPAHVLPSLLTFAQTLSEAGPPSGFPGFMYTAGPAMIPQLVPSGTPNNFVSSLAAILSTIYDGESEDENEGNVGGEGNLEAEDPILSSEQTVLFTPPSAAFQSAFMTSLAKYQENTTSGHQNTAAANTSSTTTPSGTLPGVLSDTTDAQGDSAGVSDTTASSQDDGSSLSQTVTSATSQPSPFDFTFVPASELTLSTTPSASLGQPSAPTINPWVSFTIQDFITAIPDVLSANSFEEVWPSLSTFAQTLVHDMLFTLPLPPIPIIPMNFINPFGPRRPRFDATAFVDSLEQVDVSTIPAHNMRCPHCWLPFGTTDEDDPAFVFAPDQDDPPEIAARRIALHELPFSQSRADNDPVRTPCGHLFGKGCLIDSMEKVDTLCPICRQELRPKPEVPA
jgi:hypothetical protein